MPIPRQEERRIVTILFADVSGFTALSETLDPEEVREVMNECFGLLSAEVYRRGGVVDKYIGDNVMALFGLPRASEDDATRAVRAAMAMQRALAAFGESLRRERGFSVSMRIGINTGLVVAGAVGSEQRSDFTVMGDAVNLASRIEHHCRPGEVWVSRATRQAALAAFEFERLAPIEVKGKSRPQVFYRVLRERAGGGAPQGPFAGRASELAALRRALEASLSGSFHAVTVSGEAGVGKSRLLAEFLREAKEPLARAGGRVVHSFSLPGDSCLCSLFGGAARELGVAPPEAPSPQEAPGAAGGPGGLAAKTAFFRRMEDALRAAASAGPVVLVLEDMHFSDDASWELVMQLLSRMGGSRLMLLCLLRPEVERQAPWTAADGYTPIALGRLDEEASLAVIEGTLGPNELPRDVKLELAGRAGGHAYFLTELLRDLLECGSVCREGGVLSLHGGYCLSTPESVQGAVLARLDRLGALERAVLQAAACAGFEFSPPLVDLLEPAAAPSAPRCEALERRRFLDRRREGDFAFTHDILREVCYESILLSRRREYHLRLARHWEGLGPGPQGRHLYRAADHYHLARERGPSLAANWRAARHAECAYAPDQALVHLERVLALLEAGPATERDREEVPPPGVVGVRPTEPADETPSLAEALFKTAEMYSWGFDPDRAFERFQRSLAMLPECHPRRVEAYRRLAIIHNIRGEPDEAERMLERAGEEMDAACALEEGPAADRASSRAIAASEARGGASAVGPAAADTGGREALGVFFEAAIAFFRSGKDDEARRWVGRIVRRHREIGRPLPGGLPPDFDPASADLHEVMAAFAHLAS